VAQHSFCDRLNSDLGSEFHNGLFKELSAKIGFKHTFSSVAHPTSNGQVERANRNILSYMRKFITENSEWESMLPA
jgi:transposase InsO family protein